MIIYQNEKYVVTQSEINKRVTFGKKLPDGCIETKWHLSLDKTAQILTADEGKNLLEQGLTLLGLK